MDCAKCNKPIKLMKVENNGKFYHMGCYTCKACNGSLKNRKTESLAGDLYHIDCFNQIQDVICAKCHKLVTEVAMDHGGKCYHEACFVCTTCKESLEGKKFFAEGGEFYDENCYKQQNSLMCDQCMFEIDGTDVKYVTYFDKYIHHECFTCSACNKQLSTAEKFRDVKTTVKGALICMPCSLKAPRIKQTRIMRFGEFAWSQLTENGDIVWIYIRN